MRGGNYARVSTDDQARHGYSIAEQLDAGRALLYELGCTDIVEYVDDGYSGAYLDRPGITELRQDAASGLLDVVAIYDPDRLARKLSIQLLVAEELEKNKIKLYFVNDQFDQSPSGKLFFSMKGAIAEFEKEKIADRTWNGKKRKRKEKKLSDNGLYGYDFVPETCTYTVNEEQANVIREVFNLVIHRQMSIMGVQAEFKARVILSPTGKPLWPTSTLYNIVTNKTYTGVFISLQKRQQKTGIRSRITTIRPESEWIEIPVPAIIDIETYEKAQQQLARNKAVTKRQMLYPYLLQGILFCGVCGRRMLAHHCAFRDGSYKSYYQCSSQRYANLRNAGLSCDARSLPAEALDKEVWEIFIASTTDPKKAEKYMHKPKKKADNSSELARLTEMETDLVNRRKTIARWFRTQRIGEEEADAELNSIGLQLEQIAARRKELVPAPVSNSKASFQELSQIVKKLITGDSLSPDRKRRIIQQVLRKITAVRTDHHTGKGARSKPPTFKVTWEV